MSHNVLNVSDVPGTDGLYVVVTQSHVGEVKASYKLDAARANALLSQCHDQHIPVRRPGLQQLTQLLAAHAPEPAPFDTAGGQYGTVQQDFVPAAPAGGTAQSVVRMPFRHGGGTDSEDRPDENC